MNQLTDKQKRFCDEYLIDSNGTQAATRAGYSHKTAQQQSSDLLLNPVVKAYLREKQEALAKKLNLDAEWVLKNWKTIAERCLQCSPVLDKKGKPVLIENNDGEMVPAFVFDSSGANRATELVAKHLGMFVEKTEVTINDALASRLSAARKRNAKA